jgi:hypothetical protein
MEFGLCTCIRRHKIDDTQQRAATNVHIKARFPACWQTVIGFIERCVVCVPALRARAGQTESAITARRTLRPILCTVQHILRSMVMCITQIADNLDSAIQQPKKDTPPCHPEASAMDMKVPKIDAEFEVWHRHIDIIEVRRRRLCKLHHSLLTFQKMKVPSARLWPRDLSIRESASYALRTQGGVLLQIHFD